jgi:hypothetical protein
MSKIKSELYRTVSTQLLVSTVIIYEYYAYCLHFISQLVQYKGRKLTGDKLRKHEPEPRYYDCEAAAVGLLNDNHNV